MILHLVGWATPRGAAHVACHGYLGSYPPHARTKHIDVRHYFIRDHQQKGDIYIESVGTEDQLADIFTKPLDEKRFYKLRNELNILDFPNMC